MKVTSPSFNNCVEVKINCSHLVMRGSRRKSIIESDFFCQNRLCKRADERKGKTLYLEFDTATSALLSQINADGRR